MKFYIIGAILALSVVQLSCLGDKAKQSDNQEASAEVQLDASATDAAAAAISERLCADFPEALLLKYNPDGIKITSEEVEFTPGQLAHCKIKLFYGERDYDYWEGQVGAWVPKTPNPFWQYDPERNPNVYHKVTEFGEEAVFIATTNQLLILKEGIVYEIVPPSRGGATTNSGKSNKEIALEMAQHYGI